MANVCRERDHQEDHFSTTSHGTYNPLCAIERPCTYAITRVTIGKLKGMQFKTEDSSLRAARRGVRRQETPASIIQDRAVGDNRSRLHALGDGPLLLHAIAEKDHRAGIATPTTCYSPDSCLFKTLPRAQLLILVLAALQQPDGTQSAASDNQAAPVAPQASDTGRPGSGAWNAPVAYTENSSQMFGFDEKAAKPKYQRLATEALSTALGPMPVDAFLDTFFPKEHIPRDDMPPSEGAFRLVAQAINMIRESGKKLREPDLYTPLVRALNARKSCPGYTFRITSNHVDGSHGKLGAIKPDVICYADRHLTSRELTSEDVRARTDMGFAETFIEVKLDDPLCDPPSGKDPSAWPFFLGNRKASAGSGIHNKCLEDLGQGIAYAVEILARQHRFFLFTVTLALTRARLIRWDRAGLIVTKSFDIIEEPHYLCLFFWCLSRLSDPARGFDNTVELASKAEEDLFRRSIQAHLIKQTALDATSDAMRQQLHVHYKPGYVTAIRMHSLAAGTVVSAPRKLLISRPICIPLSPSGRCTRTYWAVVLTESDVSDTTVRDVWLLKDTWRTVALKSHASGYARPMFVP
ncbi:hypothetical protein NUW54_g3803 [Trametes sanguinea]|uniref:Uncharacterized protein n=1 Tax=Trametes sanguinea TaxID=158606 RepID=A0ACC1Q0A9_9APHY|nr:hypothetical protein NUW54_g3803 [Trametes sanguinea]